MSDKNSDVDIQEINKKLDFLIGEVAQIKNEVSRIQAKNNDSLFKLDSKFYEVCNSLKDQIYKLQSEVYSYSTKLSDGNYKVEQGLQKLQEKTTYSKFVDLLVPLSPIFLAGGTVWCIFMYKLLH